MYLLYLFTRRCFVEEGNGDRIQNSNLSLCGVAVGVGRSVNLLGQIRNLWGHAGRQPNLGPNAASRVTADLLCFSVLVCRNSTRRIYDGKRFL
jgi:hypothetical protein